MTARLSTLLLLLALPAFAQDAPDEAKPDALVTRWSVDLPASWKAAAVGEAFWLFRMGTTVRVVSSKDGRTQHDIRLDVPSAPFGANDKFAVTLKRGGTLVVVETPNGKQRARIDDTINWVFGPPPLGNLYVHCGGAEPFQLFRVDRSKMQLQDNPLDLRNYGTDAKRVGDLVILRVSDPKVPRPVIRAFDLVKDKVAWQAIVGGLKLRKRNPGAPDVRPDRPLDIQAADKLVTVLAEKAVKELNPAKAEYQLGYYLWPLDVRRGKGRKVDLKQPAGSGEPTLRWVPGDRHPWMQVRWPIGSGKSAKTVFDLHDLRGKSKCRLGPTTFSDVIGGVSGQFVAVRPSGGFTVLSIGRKSVSEAWGQGRGAPPLIHDGEYVHLRVEEGKLTLRRTDEAGEAVAERLVTLVEPKLAWFGSHLLIYGGGGFEIVHPYTLKTLKAFATPALEGPSKDDAVVSVERMPNGVDTMVRTARRLMRVDVGELDKPRKSDR